MGARKQSKVELITLDEAIELSDGYFTSRRSLLNLICQGKFKRFGPHKKPMIRRDDFMRYLEGDL